MKKYRAGIAGSTHINSHLYSLSAVPSVDLVAAVASTEKEKKYFQDHGISNIYPNYHQMLDNENLDDNNSDNMNVDNNGLWRAAIHAAKHTFESSILPTAVPFAMPLL